MAERFLNAVLSADVDLVALVGGEEEFYNGAPPGSATEPYVRWDLQSATDYNVVGANSRLWANCLYLVRGVNLGDSFETPLVDIADRIDTLIHRVSTVEVPGGGVVHECYRESPFRLREPQGDQTYAHLGGMYRILASQGV